MVLDKGNANQLGCVDTHPEMHEVRYNEDEASSYDSAPRWPQYYYC